MTADLTTVLRELLRDVVREEVRAALRDLQLGGADDLLSYAAAAKFAGVKACTIGRWVHDELLPATGKGRGRRVKRSEVVRALDRMRADAPARAPQTSERAMAIVRSIR